MGKHEESSVLETVHVELRSALSELAKSVDLAVKRMALRTELSTTIVEAERALDAADALRDVATKSQDGVPLVPQSEQAEISKNVSDSDAAEMMSKVEAACVALARNS
jgi:hypothetical protein